MNLTISHLTTSTRFAALGAVGASGSLVSRTASAAETRFAFDGIAANTLDSITVPDGYSVKTLVRWGDPLWSDAADFDGESRGSADSQSTAFGDNNDGMEVYFHEGKTLLVVNNEYTNRKIIWGNRDEGKPTTDNDVLKGKMAHGLTVVEIAQTNGEWDIVKDSPYNRRVTPDTPMTMTGPAAGHEKRYGVSGKDWGYGWAKIDDRFDVAKNPNEPNRAGYVVEIDPRQPDSAPRKLTALGRFKHENAEVVINADGRIVVYMGDDERGEFLYRFVSKGVYAPGAETDSLLEEGDLYVAKFHDTGAGEWLLLNPETTGLASQAEVCVHTRQAASAVGATTMDRPEWVSANPQFPEVYCCLTNNKNRGKKPNAGGDLTPASGANPREENHYGQIVRWRPNAGDHAANGFAWDLYLLAGNPVVHSDANAGSANITADNMFNSPDGLKFDSNGILWIQTDGNYSNTDNFAGHGNNQMLAADPVSGEIRRFLVGPNEAEVTGLTWSSDKRTMFVGIQHPGGRR